MSSLTLAGERASASKAPAMKSTLLLPELLEALIFFTPLPAKVSHCQASRRAM